MLPPQINGLIGKHKLQLENGWIMAHEIRQIDRKEKPRELKKTGFVFFVVFITPII